MIRRTLDGTFLTSVANDPEVRPYIGAPTADGFEELDLRPMIADPSNVTLVTEHGGWILQAVLPGVYELHTLFLPEGRGKPYFKAAKEALRYAFTSTDCLELLTRCPDDNAGARMAAALVGFRERFRRDHAWNVGTPSECGVSYQAFTIDDFIARDIRVREVGIEFHHALETAKAAAGSGLPVHPEDEAHDRVVGACYLMAQAGFVDKAVGIYGRWAAFAGYQPILKLAPNVLDVRDAIVEIKDNRMEVLLVR